MMSLHYVAAGRIEPVVDTSSMNYITQRGIKECGECLWLSWQPSPQSNREGSVYSYVSYMAMQAPLGDK